MRDDDELIGIKEIADLAKVSKQAVANWRSRLSDFPRPISELASGPIFRRSQVIAWLVGKRNMLADHCPVCLNLAERGPDGDYGDKKRVHCSRCGPFEITGTALAMLGKRVAQDSLVRARLSHAIRSRTSEDAWLRIDSENLDRLGRQTLPDIPQQLQHLASWLAKQLRDDQLGRVRFPEPESLAGVIGTVDGQRVERLIGHAVRQGIVEHDPENDMIGLSPEGWEMLRTS